MRNTIITIIGLLCAFAMHAQEQQYRVTHYDDHNGMSQWHTTKILQDRYGMMWFSTWNGLNRYDGYNFDVFKSVPGDGINLLSDRIRNMLLGDDGNIYCLISDRVWRFNLTTYKFEEPDNATQERYMARINDDRQVTPEHDVTFGGITFKNVRQLFIDSQKNGWVMGKYGVEKVSPASQPATMLPSISANTVRAIYMDKKRRIWITTKEDHRVAVLNDKAELIGYLGTDGRLHKEPVAFAPIYCVMQQKNGTFWLGSKPNGLYRLTESGDGIFKIELFKEGENGLASHDIYDIKEDKKGRLWIATQYGGLHLLVNPQAEKPRFLNPKNTFKGFPENSMLLRRIMIVNDTTLLATATKGFLVLEDINVDPRKMKFNLHTRESNRAKSLSSSATMDMVIDRKGRLFISTESGGVNMLLTKDLCSKQFDFKHFSTLNGMGSDVALAMTEVGDQILVQCNNQVTRINADLDTKENFNDLFFSIASRFSDAEPILLRDGRWLLSLETGIITIPEEMFHRRSYIPRIVLTSFTIPGKATDYTANHSDTITLEPPFRDLTINYAALDYSDNSHIKYITRLISDHYYWFTPDTSQWTVPVESRTTSLNNISPGTYTLEIASTNAEGLWVLNNRKVTIIVEPTFWETPLAFLLYFLAAVGLIYGIVYTRFYIRTLEKEREENLQAYLKLINDRPAETETIPATPTTHINEEDDAFMRRLLDFVEEHIGDSSIGVDDMASATATSRSSLNRKTKTLLGVTPADFLKEARLQRATQQLLTTSRTVNDIAYACGFSDPKYFSKCFKAKEGMSPSEFRSAKIGE